MNKQINKFKQFQEYCELKKDNESFKNKSLKEQIKEFQEFLDFIEIQKELLDKEHVQQEPVQQEPVQQESVQQEQVQKRNKRKKSISLDESDDLSFSDDESVSDESIEDESEKPEKKRKINERLPDEITEKIAFYMYYSFMTNGEIANELGIEVHHVTNRKRGNNKLIKELDSDVVKRNQIRKKLKEQIQLVKYTKQYYFDACLSKHKLNLLFVNNNIDGEQEDKIIELVNDTNDQYLIRLVSKYIYVNNI